jgi:flagellar biosynthesis protein FliQ
VSFARLSWGHWLAAGAALALLIIMATDWYGTVFADALRRDEGLVSTGGQRSGEIGRRLAEDIPAAAELGERNAWQAYAGLDLPVLLLLLAAVVSALVAAALFAAARVYEPAASTVPTVVGVLAILAVSYRLIDEPGFDTITTVRSGAPLGLLALGLLTFGSARAMRVEGRADPADLRSAPQRERTRRPVA